MVLTIFHYRKSGKGSGLTTFLRDMVALGFLRFFSSASFREEIEKGINHDIDAIEGCRYSQRYKENRVK